MIMTEAKMGKHTNRAQYTNQKPMYDTDHNSLIHDSVPHKHVRGSGATPTTCLSLDNFYH